MRLVVPLWSLAAASGLFVVAALVLLRLIREEEALAARLRWVRSGGRQFQPAAAASEHGPLVRLVEKVGGALTRSRLLPAKTLAELETVLSQAGMKNANRLALFVGAKAGLLLGIPLLLLLVLPGSLSTLTYDGLLAAGAGIGLLAPDYWIKRRRKSYLAALERGLADALDMMVICSEAGLGLEPAIERVGQEIAHAHTTVAEEFGITAGELRVLSDRRQALLNLGARTGIDSLKRLGATLVQTLQYGTPLAVALRTLSAELRAEALSRFEARAARLPVLLTLPMIIFILPCLFIVVGAPAAIQAFGGS